MIVSRFCFFLETGTFVSMSNKYRLHLIVSHDPEVGHFVDFCFLLDCIRYIRYE